MAQRRVAAVANIPSFRDFVHRSRVLTQYRSFLRELRGLDATQAREMRAHIRDSFRRAGAPGTAMTGGEKKAALAEGERQLLQLRSYAAGIRKHVENAAAMAPGTDTWVGTGPEDDRRGRVGQGWPWASGETHGQQ